MKKASRKKTAKPRPGISLRMSEETKEVLLRAMEEADHQFFSGWIMVVLRKEAKRLLGNDCFKGIAVEDQEGT